MVKTARYIHHFGPYDYFASSNKNNLSYLIKGISTRQAPIDTDNLVIFVEPQQKSKFDIQALREAERGYLRRQIALEALRDNQRQRSTSFRAQRARDSLRRRVIDN